MGGMNWTEEQKKVITLRNRNLLVSAAAGSGKTATLVERIMTWLCDKERPGEIDRLLVLTFTKAAAAEMKERLLQAIEKRLEAEPGNIHMQRQSTLVHNAQITTIDSFCLYVVRNYFHLLSIDPGFRIGDEGELKLLQKEVLEELIEESYADGSEDFHAFVEAYATGKRDEVLGDLIQQLSNFALGYPYPARWLKECKEAYGIKNPKELEESDWMQRILSFTRQTLESVKKQLQAGIAVCESAAGPYLYEETLNKDLLLVEELLLARTYTEYQELFSSLTYARLTTKRMKEDVSEEKKEQVKSIRENMKKCLKNLKENYYAQPLTLAAEYLTKASPSTCTLLELAENYLEKFDQKKRSKNMVDFSDLEHLALEVLVQDVTTDEEGNLQVIPTLAARELAEHFEEIMIDEYQDSNLLQEVLLTSVSRTLQGTPNVFMVGDVKQSIYGFRLARPELFLEKYKTYSLLESLYQRIDLHQNFRSRKEVLESANCIFKKIMTPAVGGISYDADAALYLGADYPKAQSDWNQTEVLVLETEKEDEPQESESLPGFGERTERELEAAMIGNRIQSLMEEMQVWDGKTGAYRPLEYGDIVILLRSLKGWGDVFARVLEEQGIPAYTESRTGYFDTIEVRTVLNLLRIVDNPRQDIPLAAVMRSMIGGFTDEELAQIKSAYKEQRFHMACLNYAKQVEYENETDTAEGQPRTDMLAFRLHQFYEKLEGYRFKAQYLSIHEFISYVLEDTGYGDYLEVQPGGAQRSANIRMLIERAIAFESTSYRGLFHFVRYMEQLQSYQEDLGEASVSGEGVHAVRIVSIHKSKGLEFPVVFVAGLGKHFNYQDSRSKVVLHPDLGVGVDFVDSVLRVRTPTLPKKLIQKSLELEMLGEELRVLYVALTRAKEKLILCGAISDLDKKLGKVSVPKECEELDYLELTGARTYWDWILPAVWEEKSFALIRKTPEDLVLSALQEQIRKEGKREELERLLQETGGISKEEQLLDENLSYRYPFEMETGLQPKVSVSELKRSGQVEEEEMDTLLFKEPEIIPYVPRFMQEGETLTGAARGTAYHRALQYLDLERMTHTERIKEALDNLVEQKKLTKEMAQSIRPWDIYTFCRTPLAKRMIRAEKKGCLYMEQPFVISIPAKELSMEWDSEEPMLVQGIIDAWFYEDASSSDKATENPVEPEIVILDYKTDWVQDGKELLERYGKQLDYYQKALEQITRKRVKEKLIYSFCLGEMISCP